MYKRPKHLEGDPNARQKHELQERSKWAARAISIVEGAGLPISKLAQESPNKEHILMQVCQGRRVGTLKTRIRAWEKAARYVWHATGYSWPKSISAIFDYMAALGEAGQPVHVDHFLSALAFFEKGGGVGEAQAFHRNPSVIACAEETKAHMLQETKPTKKAPQVPLAIGIGLERCVEDKKQPEYWRMLSWWRLVKIWGCLRHDDHRGLIPSRLRLDKSGLHATLVRTKTSGSGKKIEELPVFISSDVFLVEPDWLVSGYDLWWAVS